MKYKIVKKTIKKDFSEENIDVFTIFHEIPCFSEEERMENEGRWQESWSGDLHHVSSKRSYFSSKEKAENYIYTCCKYHEII
jgi:hypothetical protein